MRPKSLLVFFASLVVVAALVAGAIYFSQQKKHQKAAAQLALAENLLKKNDTEKALTQLKELYQRYPKYAFAEKVHFLLSKTLYDTKQYAEAEKYLDAFLKRFPHSDSADDALYYKGKILLESGKNAEEAGATFNRILKDYPNSDSANRALLGLAQIRYEAADLAAAKKQLEALLEKQMQPDVRDEAEALLGDVNLKLLLSPEPQEGDMLYEIKKGDFLYNLARKHKVTQELLLRANGISDPRYLSIGQRIKIPKTDFSIVVDKSDNTLTLLSGGKFFKKYRVRTGVYDQQTPVGEYRIENKKKNPEWYNPREHKRYAGGDPNNELGSRWMSFYQDKLGIHGTIHPETVGQYASYGCVGMRTEDVEELFDLVTIGTPVKIIGKKQGS
jgi:lipoprotein-anchoring transpeptidase ErfK/SrfK/outer membrane protein assembly factor BamD (BamD/ComL family)